MINLKKILLVESQRELLLFLLLNKKYEDLYFIFFDNFDKEIIKNFSKNSKVIQYFYPKKNGILKIIEKIFYLKEKRKAKEDLKGEFYGYDHSLMGAIYNEEKLILLEDGMLDYKILNGKKKIKLNFKEFIKKIVYNQRTPNDYNSFKITKIYLSDFFQYNLPKNLLKKTQIINFKKLWFEKSIEEKKYILQVFNITELSFRIINNKETILFTQPLSEDKCISEEEKISIYREILKKYKEKEVVIKPHPREKTNYKEHFPKYCILEEKVPIELLILNGLEIKKAVTLFSTAVFGLGKDTEIDFYGTEVHPNILRRFGSMDRIMKRNKFL